MKLNQFQTVQSIFLPFFVFYDNLRKQQYQFLYKEAAEVEIQRSAAILNQKKKVFGLKLLKR